MAEAAVPSVIGGWLCVREDRDRRRLPVRFEASFANAPGGFAPGAFTGEILEEIGPLQTAASCTVRHGLQIDRHVRFVQMPAERGRDTDRAPIHYHGTLSPDGCTLSGFWEHRVRHAGRLVRQHGAWEARRLFWEGDSPSSGAADSA